MSAAGNGFTETSFRFLADLAENNHREWFTAHRSTFDEHVDEPFTAVLADVGTRLAGTALPLRGGPATTFRMNRDVRFAKDKSPYNTHRGGVLTRSGTKEQDGPLVYVHLDVTGGFLAGGLYQPPTARLDPVRQAILDDPDRFAGVVVALATNGLELDRSAVVKTMPRGYAEHAGHPQADGLRLKQFVVQQRLPKAAWLEDDVVGRIADFALGVAPLFGYLESVHD